MTARAIGSAVSTLPVGPAAGRLHEVAAAGISYIEPKFSDPDAREVNEAAVIESIRRDIDDAGLRVWSVHTPFGRDFDISSPDDGIRERGVAATLRTARGCATLTDGTGMIVVHLSDSLPPDAGRVQRVRTAMGSLARVVDECARIGVTVAVENLPPGYIGATAEELLAGIDPFPNELVGVCIDTGHANLVGGAVEIVQELAPRIITTHLHDNDGAGDQHLVPGEGIADWDGICRALATSPYRGPLMFEASGPGSREEVISRLRETGARLSATMETM